MKNSIFIDIEKLGLPQNEYVCWLDIMGSKNKMTTSVQTCGNNIFRFHVSVLRAIEALNSKVHAYPVMDGVYLTAKKRKKMEELLQSIFNVLKSTFITSDTIHQKFMVRGAVAYGPVYHGCQVTSQVNKELCESELRYKESLLLGTPMIQACEGEKYAPPFGIYIHESARTFSPPDEESFPLRWWKWWKPSRAKYQANPQQKTPRNRPSDEKMSTFGTLIKSYYDECERCSHSLNYPIEKIREHRALALEYFKDNIGTAERTMEEE